MRLRPGASGGFRYLFNAEGGRIVGAVLGGTAGLIAGLETGPGAVVSAAAGAIEGAELGSALEDAFTAITTFAYHHTFGDYLSSITSEGLRPGSYATPNGDLTPLQAQIDLALSPNQGLRDAVVTVDLDGLRAAGYEIPQITQVGRDFNMPGGGYEMHFPYQIPPQFLSIPSK